MLLFLQEFSSDMGSRKVQRIGDVSGLRNYQFPEVWKSNFVKISIHYNVDFSYTYVDI